MQPSRKPSKIGAIILGALMALATPALASDIFTEEFHRTVPLSANGRVSLENVNGNVTITGWERNEVQIDAVKKADTQEKLAEATIEVVTSSDSVRIKTKYPENHHNNNPASVTYTLHVPRGAELDSINLVNGSLDVSQVSGEIRTSLVNGKTTVHDLAGRADFSAVNGAINANYRSLANVSEIKVHAVNGAVRLGLPSSPNADVSVSTVNGGISTDFPLTVQGKFMGHRIDGRLGSGGTHIDISNVNGSVHIGEGEGAL
ncbi:MAG TPA: DUF4097 family beta strand repeat-containing protein [Candidatus Bathyarchaeia archaeon]|nr:DUF4097 family beta strand repeat-containing protein [Candidatus Bathyarchaeia archaeon]